MRFMNARNPSRSVVLRPALRAGVSLPAGQTATGCAVGAGEANPAQRVRDNGNYALPLDESEDLLNRLTRRTPPPREPAGYPSWSVVDLVMWNMRCTIHHGEAFTALSGSLMHRSQTQGDQLFFASASVAA
jgi:hypothetical protein